MRKILKKGFTLAEVLITLAILGVVAAVTLPNMVQDVKYQQIGAKLAKFNATFENAMTAYVISTGEEFPMQSRGYNPVTKLVNMILGIGGSNPLPYLSNGGNGNTVILTSPQLHDIGENYINLKDGSKFVFFVNQREVLNTEADISSSQENAVGPASDVAIVYDPNVKGIPSDGQGVFVFVLTTKGYMYPIKKDTCLQAIINNDWKVSPSFYKSNGACMKTSW